MNVELGQNAMWNFNYRSAWITSKNVSKDLNAQTQEWLRKNVKRMTKKVCLESWIKFCSKRFTYHSVIFRIIFKNLVVGMYVDHKSFTFFDKNKFWFKSCRIISYNFKMNEVGTILVQRFRFLNFQQKRLQINWNLSLEICARQTRNELLQYSSEI